MSAVMYIGEAMIDTKGSIEPVQLSIFAKETKHPNGVYLEQLTDRESYFTLNNGGMMRVGMLLMQYGVFGHEHFPGSGIPYQITPEVLEAIAEVRFAQQLRTNLPPGVPTMKLVTTSRNTVKMVFPNGTDTHDWLLGVLVWMEGWMNYAYRMHGPKATFIIY